MTQMVLGTTALAICMFMLGVIYGRGLILDKLYGPNGQCRECLHPKQWMADHAEGWRWDRHHPNCPIGRLGA